MKALKAASDRLYAEQPKDRPSVGKVRADALALVAESALKGGLDPGSSGDRYQVVVHVNDEELRAGKNEPAVERAPRVSAETPGPRVSAETPQTGGAWLGDPHVLVSAEAARRIACDAGKVCMSHRSGQILSVGRKTRTIPPPIRRALEFRDRGCRFPGCTSQHCDAHHIVHWADGGETKLSNLVLLCRRHHRLLHEGGFRVRMSEDGTVQFVESQRTSAGAKSRTAAGGPQRGRGAGRVPGGRRHFDHRQGVDAKLRRPAHGPALYVMECLWRPPPHLAAVAARERTREGSRRSRDTRAALAGAFCGWFPLGLGRSHDRETGELISSGRMIQVLSRIRRRSRAFTPAWVSRRFMKRRNVSC